MQSEISVPLNINANINPNGVPGILSQSVICANDRYNFWNKFKLSKVKLRNVINILIWAKRGYDLLFCPYAWCYHTKSSTR